LAVTFIGGENGDAVCLWKGDSQEHISSAMNTIIHSEPEKNVAVYF